MEFPKIKKRFDKQIEGLLERLEEANGIQERRRIRLEEDPTDSRKKRYNKKEKKIEELKEKIKEIRAKIELVVNFNPTEDQYREVKRDFDMVGERGEIWTKKVPNCKYKTFQDIFAPPGRRTVPRDRSKYRTAEDYDRIDLNTCAMYSDYIPDWFLEGFNIYDLPDCSDGFEKAQARLKAKPEIVNFWGHLNPMSPYGPGQVDGRQRLLVIEGYKTKHNGKIIIPSSRRSSDTNRKIIQPFDSIYKAQRSREHIKGGYQEEKPTIFSVQNRIRSILNRTRGLKEDNPETDKVCEAIIAEAKNLEGVVNVHKESAHSILTQVKGIRDSLDRHNPGATCMKLLKAIDHFKGRLPEILRISDSINADRDTLNMRIDFGEGALGYCQEEFEVICEQLEQVRLRQDNGPLFGKDPDKVYEEVAMRLDSIQDVETLQIRPFNLYAAKILERKEAMKAALEAGDQDMLEKEAVKAFVICKIFEIQKKREKILYSVSVVPKETQLESLVTIGRHLQNETEAREVFPDAKVGYHDVYADLQKKVEGLVRGLEHYDQKDLSPHEKREMYTSLKEYLEGIDFAEILEQLD